MKPDARSLYRLQNRVSQLQVQPDPPRGVRFANGTLSWDKPRNHRGVTHYRIYADNEGNLARVVPVGQTSLADNLTADRVFITAYNQDAGLESSPAFLAANIGPTISSALTADGYWTYTASGGNIVIDFQHGRVARVVLTNPTFTFKVPIYTGHAISDGDRLFIYVEQDATGGRPGPNFELAVAGGFEQEVQDVSNQIGRDALTRSLWALRKHSNDRWGIDNFRTGGPIG